MAQRWWLDTPEQLEHFVEWVKLEQVAHRKVCVEIHRPGRTIDQNSMLHELIAEIYHQKGDETEVEIKRYIKLHFGVPILRASSEDFREKYDASVKHLPYEEKLIAMDILPVTSSMDKDQFARLLDTVLQHYTAAGIELRRQ